MNQQAFSLGYRLSCATTLTALCLSLSACSGEAGSSAAPTTEGVAGSPSAGAGAGNDAGAPGKPSTGNGTAGSGGAITGPCGSDAVCASLNGLGIDTKKTPRVGAAGGELPASFNPFGGKVTALYPRQELFIGGLGLEGTTDNAQIVERHADKTADPKTSVLSQKQEAWTQAALHTAVAGDFDGNGRQEIAGLYVKDGSLYLHSIGDEQSQFAVTETLLGKYEATALSAIAADFDDDGKDELCIALAQTAGTRLLFADDASARFAIDAKRTKTLPRDTASSSLSHHLAAGNLDYDGAKELVVVANEVVGPFMDGNAGSHYFVFDDAGSQYAALKDGLVQGKDGKVYTALLAAPAVVDADADGLGEVVLAGLLNHRSSDPVELILVALDDLPHGLAPLAVKHTLDYRDLDQGKGEQRYENVFVNGLDLDGDLAPDIQVNQTVFSNFSKSAAPFSKLWEIDGEQFQSKQGFEFRIDNTTMAVGDINGDRHDDIIAFTADRSAIGVWGFTGLKAGSNVPTFGKIDTIPVTRTAHDSRGYPMLVPVNVDDDTSLLEFSEAKSDFVFTEPLVIAAIAAPPCQHEIGQSLDACRTSFGTAETHQVSKENSVTVSASVSVGVSFEDRTFTQSAVDIQATATVAATRTRGTAYTVEKSVTFSTGSMEDAVVFTTIPYDRYSYRIISDPHPELVGSIATISVPREPVTLMVERSFYNAHVAPGSTLIDDSVFQHVIGERASYPTVSDKDQLLARYGGLESNEVAVAQGTGEMGVGLDVSNEISSGQELELGYEMSVSLTAGGVMGGFTVGGSVSNDLTIVSGKSTSYAGSVGAIDAAHFAQNQYRFGLFTYPYRAPNGAKLEVLNYWVK